MEAKKSSFKILMFPWLAYGHISPFMELAKKLSQNNFEIWLCSTPANLNSIKSKLQHNSLSNSIQFVELNLPSLPELPPHMHTTKGLPNHLNSTLFKAFDMSASQFHDILHKINPHLLITELTQPWAIQSANSLNIPVVFFLVANIVSISFLFHSFVNPGVQFPFPEILDLQPHSSSTFDDGLMNMVKRWMQSMKLCSLVLVNTFEEIEGKYIEYFSKLIAKKIVLVGPLVREVDQESDAILEWLDKKEPGSTVYVSFGSEHFLSKTDREELALGLEMSGANFIWVVRFPKGEEMEIEKAMPDGFMERVGDRGIVVNAWVPQMKILNHSNVGGFVSHCGWNSVLEAATCGVPIIALPMHVDQPINADVAVSAGIGVRIERGVNGAIPRQGVANAIKQVFFQKTKEDLIQKGKHICGILKAKQGQNIEGCVAELHQLCEPSKMI